MAERRVDNTKIVKARMSVNSGLKIPIARGLCLVLSITASISLSKYMLTAVVEAIAKKPSTSKRMCLERGAVSPPPNKYDAYDEASNNSVCLTFISVVSATISLALWFRFNLIVFFKLKAYQDVV